MGAGRPAKPTALKRLQGNPGKRGLSKDEPQPEKRIPPCPKHLDGEAKKEWRRVTKELHALGLLTNVDRAALAAYCQNWSRWVKAEEELAKDDVELVLSTDKGYHHPNPWIGIANNAMKQMRVFLAEFGMTPASRSRVSAGDEGEEDPYQQYLNGQMPQEQKHDDRPGVDG